MALKDQFHYFGRYKTPLMYGCLLQKWAHDELGMPLGIPSLKGVLLHLDGYLYLHQEDWDVLIKATERAVDTQDYRLFQGLAQAFELTTKRLLGAAESVASGDPGNPAAWQEFFVAMNEMEYPWHAVLPVSDALEAYLRTYLGEHGLPESILSEFSKPARQTQFMRMQDELREFKRRMEAAEVVPDDEVAGHIARYPWFGMMHMWGAPYDRKVFGEMLESVTAEAETAGQAVPAKLEDLQREVQELTYWRNYVAEACAMGSFKVLGPLKAAADSLDISYEETKWITPEECVEALSGKALPDANMRKTREEAFGTFVENGSVRVITGDELKMKLKEVMPEIGEARQVKGLVAQRGSATGRAKIVLTPNDIYKVEKGDILIATETTPDFVPAMHRAAAIVTENGGITSHAAIVSREMGIPCVVGTRIATQVFKDGDLVEVDAIAGVARIVE